MRTTAGLMIGVLLGLLSFTATRAAGQPATPAPPTPPQPPAEIESHVIPGEQIGSLPLEELLNFLKDKVPGFNSVIVRDPDVLPDYPTLPAMTLKNVTVGQLLELIKTSFAGVEISRIDGPSAPLYLIRILPREGVPTQAQAAQAAAMKAAQAAPATPSPFDPAIGAPTVPPDVPQVKVYRLDDIVRSLTGPEGNNDAAKKAMDDVLSLIQAALDQTGGTDGAVLKVHEPTQTVIFKGSYRKMQVLEQVLDTLRPKKGEPGSIESYRLKLHELDQTVRQLQAELARTTGTSTTRP